jgi:hypothetical protein
MKGNKMKVYLKKYLLLSLTYFIVTADNSTLSAQSVDEYTHVVAEIIASLNCSHEDPEKVHELGVKIYDLLNERYSRSDIINIMMGSKESEEFYRQKNAEARWSNYLFVGQIALAAGVAIGLFYLVYQLGNMLKWNGFFPSQETQGNVKKSGGAALSHHENLNNTQQNSAESTQVSSSLNQESLSVQGQSKSGQPWTILRGEYLLNTRLQNELEQQIEHAINIGFELPTIQLNAHDHSVNATPVDNRSLLELITEQIEYAQGIGIDVTTTQ